MSGGPERLAETHTSDLVDIRSLVPGEPLRVRNSGLVLSQVIPDKQGQDGTLIVTEGRNSTMPFGKWGRDYIIWGFSDPLAVRGHHAHRSLEQVITCLQGSFVLELDDGENKQSVLMNTPNRGIRLGPMLWHSMHSFSPDCILIVRAEVYYEEADYIRDYAEFLRLVAEQAF